LIFLLPWMPRDQNDAQQFWLALLGAVRYASATATQAEPPAATPEFNGRAMVDRVLSELADRHGPLIVVIDDLHELHSQEALALLTRLLANLPAHVHAILATRRDLRLRLHRLRLAGELTEIRAVDLRFTQRETRELLEASGIALSAAGAGGVLAGWSPRPRTLRGGVLRQRPHGRRVPARRDAGARA
jgi:LuxR family transcriptional regulator, maltose regulon positive regulatory protein